MNENLQKKLVNTLRQNDLATAKKLFTRAASSPIDLEKSFKAVERQFSQNDNLPVLLDWLLQEPAIAKRLALIAKAMIIADKLDRKDQALETLAQLRGSAAAPVRFGNADRVRKFRRQGMKGDAMLEMAKLKYEGISITKPEEIFGAAEILADRIDLDQPMVEPLFAQRRDTSLSRDEWEKRVRASFSLDHILVDWPLSAHGQTSRIRSFESLMDQDAVTDVFDRINASKGILLVTFHGGFLSLARRLYAEKVEGGMSMGLDGPDPNSVSVEKDPRAALFVALRSLQDGKALLMSPDGRAGNAAAGSTEIAGARVPIATGAAFLAYESGCASAWYTVVRKGDGFVPVLVFAPRPEPKEKFDAFVTRWLSFYGQQVEAMLTGDPSTIVCRFRSWPPPRTLSADEAADI